MKQSRSQKSEQIILAASDFPFLIFLISSVWFLVFNYGHPYRIQP
jgi:hypothetical protein